MSKNKNHTSLKPNTLELSDLFKEQLFLKQVLSSENYILALINIFDDRWFSNPAIRLLTKIVFAYFKQYKKIPNIFILEKIVEKSASKIETDPKIIMQHVTEALNIKTDYDDLFIKDILLDFIKTRSIRFTICDNLDKIEKKEDISGIVSDFSDILNIDIDQDFGTNYFDDIHEHFENIQTVSARIPTGIREVDEQTNGGLLKEGRCIWVPVGMPGIGKTALITNLVVNFLRNNLKIIVITMEINEQLYLQRIDAIISNTEVNSVPRMGEKIMPQILEIKDKCPDCGLIVKEFPPKTITSLTIENYINRVIISGFKPDVILIDYLNLLKPNFDNSEMGMYEKIGSIAQEIRALTYKFFCPIVIPTQFNTEGFDNCEPSMAMIAESRAVAHHADLITAIFQTDEEKESNTINFMHLKNRLGGKINSKLPLKIDISTLKMSSNSEKVVQKKLNNNAIEKIESSLSNI